MRPESLYLQDIIEAADNVTFHLGGRPRKQFLGDKTVRAAVLHELTVIGEAAARLPSDFRARHPQVPWPKIVAFRNLVVHEYFGLDWPIVWDTATKLVPELRQQIAGVVSSEMGNPSKSAGGIWQLKITLDEIKPPIWRRLKVSGNTDLRQLHGILQRAMGWTNSHLHLFRVGEKLYGEPDAEWAMKVEDEGETRLQRISPKPGDRFIYEYDFGDGWCHKIVVEKVLPPDPGVKYAVCLDGRRACPPEDCGGAPGYERLLHSLADPSHEEHESNLEWLGGCSIQKPST